MASKQLRVLRWYQTHPNVEAHVEEVARDLQDMDAKQVGTAAAGLARKGVPGFGKTGQRGVYMFRQNSAGHEPELKQGDLLEIAYVVSPGVWLATDSGDVTGGHLYRVSIAKIS